MAHVNAFEPVERANILKMLHRGFDRLFKDSVETFNREICCGNPLVGEGTVYWEQTPYHTLTINECDGQWWCEVTNDVTCETGLYYQGWGATPEAAWEMVKALIIDEIGE